MQGNVPKLSMAACSFCHRRKTKCDRRPGGCSACSRLQISCRYPSSEKLLGRRMPRGPYKKRKSHRERELEDLVQTMAEKCDKWENAAKTALTSSPYPSYSPDSSLDVDVEVWQKETAQSLSPRSMVTSTYSGSSFNNPEKFGRPSAAYSVEKCQNFAGQNTTGPTDPDLVVTVHPELPSIEPLNSGSHWSRMFELWHIYRTHVDPVTKLIHCPSFSEQILRAASSPSAVDSSLQVLIFSICYAAVDVLSPPVVETRFQRRKDILISLYKQEMERALGEAALCQKPSLYVLQALVLHSVSLQS